ncbi:unnamed protein product [Brassicogethes aeneus]|uniref:G protein pathway suppressor 2 n=1 Tax=Brassicogethes aeneus TaxID=1431903 RepID=A0A9P0AVE4_BRAAE|nr:unnamed protein product [Brassicogethes aeneus]
MPAAVAETQESKDERSEQMWKVLKAHILRERARKRQEREQEVEEERQRKEREAREQQDVMTLGETREQISQLEAKLTQLKEEKHQLFLQLKKVLNEDDNRRRQLVKENDMNLTALQTMPSALVHQQLYISPSVPRGAPIPPQQPTFKATVKRPRSPSPQPAVPVSMYHQGYGYKPPAVNTANYQTSPQKDDGRRNTETLVRAVLWNKNSQYANQTSAFYPVAHPEISIYYPMTSREPPRGVYESPRPQTFHLEQKIPDHYQSLRTPSSHGHVVHAREGPLPVMTSQQPKTGSITSGYSVRSQAQYQQQVSSPASLYTTQSRPLYQTPGGINYLPRD